MEVVAGITLRNRKPFVWDHTSPYYLPQLRAVMVSYADFHAAPAMRRKAMDSGVREYLGVPDDVRVYLDNGSFNFLRRVGETPRAEYEEFVDKARPDWWPIPQDYIPTPGMPEAEQVACRERTMAVNREYRHDGYVPVIHIGMELQAYTAALTGDEQLAGKPHVALGGIVPNLLRAPRALPYAQVLGSLLHVRQEFRDKQLHVFGIGGTATLHLAALLGIDSVDSAGWRNRAARGLIQLPGKGDRLISDLGKWRGRTLSDAELESLAACPCPGCAEHGVEGLRATKIVGFERRATHNLFVLLDEARWLKEQIDAGTYRDSYGGRLDNTTYLPLIQRLLDFMPEEEQLAAL